MDKSFTDQDWVEFKRLYLDDLYAFAIKGKVSADEMDYNTVHRVANFNYQKVQEKTSNENAEGQEVASGENAKVKNPSVYLSLNLNEKDGGLKNITKSDIDNAIDAFHHFITKPTDASLTNKLMRFIKKLNSKEVIDHSMVDSAFADAETVTDNIIDKYFGLNLKALLGEENRDDYFNQLEFLFRQILGLYYNASSPLYVLRWCRHSMHTNEGCRPEIREGDQSREIIKFYIFTYIWVIAICRKILISLLSSDCELYYHPMRKNDKNDNSKYIKEKAASLKSKSEFKQKLLDNLEKIQGHRYNEFRAGMNLQINVLKAKPKDIFWKLREKDEYRQIQTPDAECGKYVIHGVFRYEIIFIKVNTPNGDYKEFKCTIPEFTVSKEGSITLDFEYGTYIIDLCRAEEDHITPKETAKQPVPDDKVTLVVKSDLECRITVPGVEGDYVVARNGNVTLRIPKGRHEVTLIAKNNVNYLYKTQIDAVHDTSLKVSFTEEVASHSEWWKTDLQNIVVLKKSFSDEDKFVLWDKTVDLPVYICKCYNENGFGKCETGFAGNLFYVKEETGCYRYYDLTNSNRDQIFSGHLFTFAEGKKQNCEFTGYRGKGDACVIDKDGKELYRIFESKDWNENLIGLYEDFINKFEFSDGWAAMLKPNGTIVFINEAWMEDKESRYPYDSAYYPVFHEGWCAVKNGDAYLFLKNMSRYLVEDNDTTYQLLQPVILNDGWAYICKILNGYGIIRPSADERYLLHPGCQFIESSHGLFKVRLRDEWCILDSLLDVYQKPIIFENHILSENFFICEKTSNEEYYPRYICAKDKTLEVDFEAYQIIYDNLSPLAANFIAVKNKSKKWKIYDAHGNAYKIKDKQDKENLLEYDDFAYYKDGIFFGKKDKFWECRKAKGHELINICIANWVVIDQDELFLYYTHTVKHPNGHNNIIVLRQAKIDSNSIYAEPIRAWTLVQPLQSSNPFIKYCKEGPIDSMSIKDVEEIIANIKEQFYVEYLYRLGEFWVYEENHMKSIHHPDTGLIGKECKVIESISNHLCYGHFSDGTTYIINKDRKQEIPYRKVRPITNGLAAAYATAWGFLRISEGSIKEICSPEYSEVKDFSKEGYAMVYKENQGWGLIDNRGVLVVECRYDEVEDFKNGCGYTSVRIGDSWKIIGKDGIEVSW